MTDVVGDWRCGNCNHNVADDGCGFLYSNNKVQSCERCPQEIPVNPPVILNEAELAKEQGNA